MRVVNDAAKTRERERDRGHVLTLVGGASNRLSSSSPSSKTSLTSDFFLPAGLVATGGMAGCGRSEEREREREGSFQNSNPTYPKFKTFSLQLPLSLTSTVFSLGEKRSPESS